MISLKDVSLRYPLVGHSSHSLQVALYGKVGGLINSGPRGESSYVSALSGINLHIPDGQRLGIIGHNGAGKTTLLRVICGVYPATSGQVITQGKISALTDVTLGMDMNATGLKNILFRLVFMGYSFKDANKAVGEIVDFSQLGEFINLPVHTYSTGMFLRLAFAVSTHFSPDILVLDEIVDAGDMSFRDRANERINRLLNQSRIVVLSSHNLSSIERYCDRVIVMDHGAIAFDGDPKAAFECYHAKLNQ